MPLQFVYHRKVRNNRIQVARITYTIDPPLPDGAPVLAVFLGSQQDGRRLGRCGIWHDPRYPVDTWPLPFCHRAIGTYESHPDDS